MRRYLLYALAGLGLGVGLCFINPASPLFGITSGIVGGLAVAVLDGLIVARRQLRIVYYCFRYWNKMVRVSVSYLFRIEVDGQFLLIESDRFKQYQPVGGVYKSNPSAGGDLARMDVMNDELLPIDPVSRSDLRLRVPGRHLLRFIRWFESGQNRELGGWREFQEELLGSGVLPAAEFNSISYDFVRRFYNPMRFSDWAQSHELLVADIFQLLPTAEQVTALRALQAPRAGRVCWASGDQIMRRGGGGVGALKLPIAEHSQWIL